ncbi:MAG TPA: hypothetical protein ENN09_02135 [Planctomycetes bacterium]|nr:hypothetical protein [Planctomycetota bacterium]
MTAEHTADDENPQDAPPAETAGAAEQHPGVRRAAATFAVIAAAAVAVVLAFFGIALWRVGVNMGRMASDAPWDFDAPDWDAGEPDAIRSRIDDAKASGGEVQISARDISILLTELLRDAGENEAKALVEIAAPARITARLSQPAEVRGARRWFNLEIVARLVKSPGGLTLNCDSIKAGGVDVMQWLKLEVKGMPGGEFPGALLEKALPAGASSAAVNAEGALVFTFTPPAE